MTRTQAPPPLVLQVLAALKKDGLLLLVTLAAGVVLALCTRALLPVSYSATGLVRVAAIYPTASLLQPATVAAEISTPPFLQRVRTRAGVADGSVSGLALFQTDYVQVRAVAPQKEQAERLADAATALSLAEQNELLTEIKTSALADVKASCGALAVAPILTRRATRVFPLQPAHPVLPASRVFAALGAGVGLLVGLAWMYWRAVRREGQ